jgi:hypothetical protein
MQSYVLIKGSPYTALSFSSCYSPGEEFTCCVVKNCHFTKAWHWTTSWASSDQFISQDSGTLLAMPCAIVIMHAYDGTKENVAFFLH